VFVKTALFVTVADVTVDAAKASVNSVYGSYFPIVVMSWKFSGFK